jgi:uncharacterized protein
VLDTRELGRRPGSQRLVSLTVPAPANCGIEVLRVTGGTSIDLDLRLEAVMEGVLVTGSVYADLEGECVRCLEPVVDEVDTRLQELFCYDDREPPRPGVDEGDDVSRLEGDLLNLEPVVVEAIVLALPFQPLCREDCPGLCAECGARLADDPTHAHDPAVDPRWSALAVLKEPTSQQTPRQNPASKDQY